MRVHNTPVAYMQKQADRAAGKMRRLQKRKPDIKKFYAEAQAVNDRHGIGPDHYQPPKWKFCGRKSSKKVTLPVITI